MGRNLKISVKLKIGFLFAVVITCIVGCIGIAGMRQISAADQSLYDQQTKPLQYISNMIQAVQSICIEERNAIGFSGDPAKISEIENKIDEYSVVFKENQDKYLTVLTVQEGINLVKGAGEVYDNTFFPHVKTVLKTAAQGDAESAQAVLESDAESAEKIIDTYNQCFKNSNRDALSKSTANVELTTHLTILLAVIIVIGVTACILLCTIIVRSISRPMEELVRASEHFAKGNLQTEITYQSENEIGRLAESLRSAFQSLQEIIHELSRTLGKISEKDLSMEPLESYKGDFDSVSQSVNTILNGLNDFFSVVQTSAEQVNSGSEQVSGGAQELAQETAEQAGIIEGLLASASEVSQRVRKNSDHVADTVQNIDETTKHIRQSNAQMEEMLSAMREIEDSSNEISKVINMIDSIAFQTNILALNAAVEAARAGQAGKGFSVVAEEVRNLAMKSADAAKQTTELIERSIKKVEEGSSIANSTAQTLDEAAKQIESVERTIHQIKQTSVEQAAAMSEISEDVEQISAAIQRNSATAEESAAASEELSAQADMLKKELVNFKLRP